MKNTVIPNHRIHGINRDSTLPQRIGYPVYLASRKPSSVYIVRNIMIGMSAFVVIAITLTAYHLAAK